MEKEKLKNLLKELEVELKNDEEVQRAKEEMLLKAKNRNHSLYIIALVLSNAFQFLLEWWLK